MTNRRRVRVVLAVVSVTFLSLAPLALAADDVKAFAMRMDELWTKRGDPKAVEESIETGKKALALDPQNYEAVWRLALVYWWKGQLNRDKEVRKTVGLEGMKYGELAIKLNPERAEGHLMYALAIGNYSYGVSIATAVFQGLASKFEQAALKAYELDKHLDDGAPMVALGRYYQQLPWPLRDKKKALQYLEEAKRSHPNNLRGRLHLAEAYLDLGEKEKAKTELEFVLKAEVPSENEPEAAIVKELARKDFSAWFPHEAGGK